MDTEKMKQQLIDRLADNYNDFRTELLTRERGVLIDNAAEIAATRHAYEYLNSYEFSSAELKYLLQFKNPLEVAASHWPSLDVLGNTLDDTIAEVCEQQDDLKLYPLITDAEPKETLRKIMNVDVIAALHSIMEQVTAFNREDFEYNRKMVMKAVQSEEPEKRNLLWLCRENGTHMHMERDVFIKGTRSYNNIQFYHRDCQSERVVLYGVEITGVKKGVVRGNIYERDRHQYAELAFRGASPQTDVTLTFINGQELRIPEKDFDYPARRNLEYQYGKIVEVRNEPEDESVVQGALLREHQRRERLPKGRLDTHLQKLADQRVQKEADRITTALEKLTEPNSPKKAHFMVPLSAGFSYVASTADMDRLVDKMAAQFPGQEFYFQVPDGEKTPHFFIKPEAVRQSAAERKPSIKSQLAAPPAPGDKPPEQKKQNREVR